MVVYEISEEDLTQRCNLVVAGALNLVAAFPRLLKEDPLINFPTPERVGIGIARGAACKLGSGDMVLDYSGRTLNLAARLMDLARPQGIVIDGDFGLDLLAPEMKEKFESSSVYLRGISPETPRNVFFSRGITIIPSSARRPLKEENWKSINWQSTGTAISAYTGKLIFELPAKPLVDPKAVAIALYYGRNVAGERAAFRTTAHCPAAIRYVGNKAQAAVDASPLVAALEMHKSDGEWPIDLTIMYLAEAEQPPVAKKSKRIRGKTKE